MTTTCISRGSPHSNLYTSPLNIRERLPSCVPVVWFTYWPLSYALIPSSHKEGETGLDGLNFIFEFYIAHS